MHQRSEAGMKSLNQSRKVLSIVLYESAQG